VRSILDLPRLGPDPDQPFPDTREALDSPNGLLAWGGDLQARRLLNAYRQGIFPWYSSGQPILWWSPAPRCVLFPERVYVSRRTRRRFNSGRFVLSVDRDFAGVVAGCAEPRDYDSETWITPAMKAAYISLHERGHAHSLEVHEDDELVGGIYGIAIGRVFFGESMFSRRTDASKIALIALCRLIHELGFVMLDCQVGNPHLFRMGAVDVPREVFERDLAHGIAGHAWPDNAPRPDRRW
jgi:leucyl/phenylalanyl-tRNA--protein transferase